MFILVLVTFRHIAHEVVQVETIYVVFPIFWEPASICRLGVQQACRQDNGLPQQHHGHPSFRSNDVARASGSAFCVYLKVRSPGQCSVGTMCHTNTATSSYTRKISHPGGEDAPLMLLQIIRNCLMHRERSLFIP